MTTCFCPETSSFGAHIICLWQLRLYAEQYKEVHDCTFVLHPLPFSIHVVFYFISAHHASRVPMNRMMERRSAVDIQPPKKRENRRLG